MSRRGRRNGQSKSFDSRRPFITIKYAQTLDGRLATATGESKWISGAPALRFAHRLRREHDAIMVGIGTVLTDDPRLTVRLVKGRDPLRVIVDSRLRIPTGAQVLVDGRADRTFIATTGLADPHRIAEIERLGAKVLVLPAAADASRSTSPATTNAEAGVDLAALMAELSRRRIRSILVEGGARIITSLLAQRQIDRLIVMIAPKIIGRGREAVGELGIRSLSYAITFSSIKTRRLGSDIIVDCSFSKPG